MLTQSEPYYPQDGSSTSIGAQHSNGLYHHRHLGRRFRAISVALPQDPNLWPGLDGPGTGQLRVCWTADISANERARIQVGPGSKRQEWLAI